MANLVCTYCQSKDPCFDGISMAGIPCKHPDVKIKLSEREIIRLAEIWQVRINNIKSTYHERQP